MIKQQQYECKQHTRVATSAIARDLLRPGIKVACIRVLEATVYTSGAHTLPAP